MNINKLNNIFYEKPSVPLVMGIINLDAQSFFNSSIVATTDQAIARVYKMIEEGVDLLDIGAFSSRPGMKIPSYEDERSRLIPTIKAVISSFPGVPISIDTMRSEIADEAIDLGVEIINDISAGNFDNSLPQLVARKRKTYVAMHMKGLPETMMTALNTKYENVISEIILYFSQKLNYFHEIGLHKTIIDPGFGFSKHRKDNYAILKDLNFLEILEKPVLVGLSRKSMIWKTVSQSIEEALSGTLIAEYHATLKGCHILRVHDVKETKDMLSMYQAINHEL